MAEPETEPAPMGWHRVCLNTIVRKEKVLDSERLRILPMGSRVNVVERSGRRVRIDQPIVGWCSLKSSNGDTILKPLDNDGSKIAPTPRSGQAAVSSLQNRMQSTTQKIEKARQTGQESDLVALEQEKDQLEARIEDLMHKNAQQERVFEEWRRGAESRTTETGTVTTAMNEIKFRNGDAVLLAKACKLEGIVVVRCVVNLDDGSDLIGCESQSDVPVDMRTDGTYKGEQKWTVSANMQGCWLTRQDFKSLVPTFSLLQMTEQLQQENTDLLVYRSIAKGMVKVVEAYASEYAKFEKICMHTAGKPEPKEFKGVDYAAAFSNQFKSLNVTD